MRCPLCTSKKSTLFHQDKVREYHQCGECALVYVPSSFYLNSDDEKARYNLHQNSDSTEGYRNYLEKMFVPIQGKVSSKSQGLDFGCGPGPLLFEMFEEAGYVMQKYDIFYANDSSVLSKKYDFITMTEVIEHVHHPLDVLSKLFSILNDKGVLGVMTNLYSAPKSFKTWWYKNDLTHVCFFSKDTLMWVAEHFEVYLEIVDKDVFLFCK